MNAEIDTLIMKFNSIAGQCPDPKIWQDYMDQITELNTFLAVEASKIQIAMNKLGCK